MMRTSPLVLIPRTWTAIDRLKACLAPKRKRATLAGTHVGTKIELRKTVTLCESCYWKFDYKRHGYFAVYEWDRKPVVGRCHGCGETGPDRRLYIPEETLRQAWLTRDRYRTIISQATLIG